VKLEWSEGAAKDLEAIFDFIARDSAAMAKKWVRTLRAKARRAARFPSSGRIVPELDRDDVREVVVRNYRIIYQVTTGRVVVLAVTEGHRLLRSLNPLV
jgi:toxin ParE1/3/4